MDEIKKQGFCIFKSILSANEIDSLRHHAQELISQQTEEDKRKHRSLGSLIRLWQDPFFSSLMIHPKIIGSLKKALQSQDIRFANGFLLTKPPKSIPTFWHQDWRYWSHPESYVDTVHQVGVLCYLHDVDQRNGGLRVIPGSHHKVHSLHSLLSGMDNDSLRQGENLDSVAFQHQEDELSLELKVGDIAIIDARVLHGANANHSHQHRYGIILWYYPNYCRLPESIKASIGTKCLDPEWLIYQDLMQPYLCQYQGEAVPQAIVDHPQKYINVDCGSLSI